jgi:beta-galactoside alpha-2,3-sialyltransferase (sialyltransferase 4B)
MLARDTGVSEVIRSLLRVVPGKSSLNQNGKSCLSCAIVGNSGNLLGSGYGTLIDSKDVIIRYCIASWDSTFKKLKPRTLPVL